MAINRISAPSSTPTAVSDYQAQNNLTACALSPGRDIIPFSGTAMTVGYRFNLGGTEYLVESATSISGTESAYVKITPSGDGSTCTASFVSSLSGVSWNSSYSGYYDGSGNLYVSTNFFYGQMLEFLSSGYFFTKPGQTHFYVTGTAAGGNGGNGGNSWYYTALGVWWPGSGGGGGGYGEFCINKKISCNENTLYHVTIGSVGSDTTIEISGGSTVLTLTKGGNGGNGSGSLTPGTAGYYGGGSGGDFSSASNGINIFFNYDNNSSGTGQANGGGGGGCGFFGNGGNGSAAPLINNNGINGSAATGYGAGGGGASGGYGSGYTGGTGGSGSPAVIWIHD